ncbi:ankyrin repeat domain-containing protein, partial [Campylobacter coli]|nr:ankyrin repeat domain-containing protein [Campylobacter coli]
LSLKDPKYNFYHSDMKYIKEANDKYILMEEVEDTIIYQNALIYDYILSADNPNSQIIKYLVNRGAKFEVHDEGYSGRTPMHFWARRNNYQLLELAIKGGANVNFATPTTPLDDAKGSRNKKLLKDAGAMTSEQIRKKFNLPAYDSSHCEIDGKTDMDLLGKYHDEYSKLLNDAIKKAKESE